MPKYVVVFADRDVGRITVTAASEAEARKIALGRAYAKRGKPGTQGFQTKNVYRKDDR